MLRSLYTLSLVALFFTAMVVMLGAYTRLTDAGLGCPDWPGCYGFLSVPSSATEISAAEQTYPERPIEAHKAWNEMIHRYFAGTLGLMILAIFLLSIKAKQALIFPSLLLAMVSFQALLGMWTVTLNLQPVVVMGHLLGGFTTFSLLLIQCFRLHQQLQPQWIPKLAFVSSPALHTLLKVSLVVLVLQIALGGWTASNYAAVACTELPICEQGWQDKFALRQALSVPTGFADYEYGVFSYEARMTIHILHRIGALITTLVLSVLIINLWRQPSVSQRRFAMCLLAVLCLQIGLGLANVVFQLPLFVAVAHNVVAACLLLVLLSCYWVSRVSKLENPVPSRHSASVLA